MRRGWRADPTSMTRDERDADLRCPEGSNLFDEVAHTVQAVALINRTLDGANSLPCEHQTCQLPKFLPHFGLLIGTLKIPSGALAHAHGLSTILEGEGDSRRLELGRHCRILRILGDLHPPA